MNRRNICVLGGAGPIGLIVGVGLADLGHNVVNADINAERTARLAAGEPGVHEQGMDATLLHNIEAKRICFTTDIPSAIASSDVIFITVGTPSTSDGQADLSQVIQSAEQLARKMTSYKLIVIKSTTPPGTVEMVQEILGRALKETEAFDIVVNPEFLREGNGLSDFFFPERIVIGAKSTAAITAVRELHEPIISRSHQWRGAKPTHSSHGQVPVIETTPVW